ncbi:MAG TPA: protein-L-isoaspartate(D-aspartate) O-methyltransferase [Actinobacteria bacterium]|nr:protein-L-isoaspartate(D-aspartate) O-methyltransferase [Actinomycetota bacterium]
MGAAPGRVQLGGSIWLGHRHHRCREDVHEDAYCHRPPAFYRWEDLTAPVRRHRQAPAGSGSSVIQADDGAGDPASGQGLSSSSVSAPGVVIGFLELLEVRPGDQIMEIGTGSGWTAALLCHVAGDRAVTSVEVDPALAAAAACAVKAAGYAPHLITGDGAGGHPAGAPYDRVHVTCGVADVPRAWIAQTRPGGLIVLPWSPSGSTGHRLRLAVAGDCTAVGTFHGPATYMMLRAQRVPAVWNPHHAGQAGVTATRLDPRSITDGGDGAHLAVIARVPGIGWHTIREQNGATSLLMFEADNPSGAWAACDYEPGTAEFPVNQFGARRLWDEVAAAYLSWLRSGSPGRERYGVTVDPHGTRIWPDNPQNVIGEPLPPRSRAAAQQA